MNNFCSICTNEISQERLSQVVIICQSCGWSNSESEKNLTKKLGRTVAINLLIASVILVGIFIHNAHWGKHSFEVIPLKAIQLIGAANTEDLMRISQICEDVKKYTCIEEAYKEALYQDRENHTLMEQYADILVKTKQQEKAFKVYQIYFSKDGANLDAAYEYAKILGRKGQVEESARMFNLILDSKKDILQTTVLYAFVDMYTENNKLKQAKKLIQRTRKLGENTTLFMDARLKEIKEQISGA